MITVYIVSPSPFAGKSLLALVLGLRLRDQGVQVGYFKPVGTRPVEVEGVETDSDALYIAQQLGAADQPEALCPVLFTDQLAEQAFAGSLEPKELLGRVRQAFETVAAGKEVMLVGGVGDLGRGTLLGLSAPTVAEFLDARVLLVARYEGDSTVESVLMAPRLLGERTMGVIFNYVPPQELDHLRQVVSPYLDQRRLPMLGSVPLDQVLRAITLRELADQVQAKVLCCEDRLDQLVSRFLVGAMSVASAARYFRETQDEVVITGGDRPDIQLAALQSGTKAIVCTGNLYPSEVIIKRAAQLGVPMLLVGEDTLAAVANIERIMSQLRVREESKVKRARELLEEHVDFVRLYQLAGLEA